MESGVPGTVSVIIPTFNRARFLGEALDSVLGQTYSDLEVIVVDDGSTDGTAELMSARSRDDSRVRYVPQANRGASAARNAGLDLARGEYVAFLDSDDAWKPWHLELGLGCLERTPEAGLVWSNIEFVDDAGVLLRSSALPELLSNYDRFPLDRLFEGGRSLAELGLIPPPGDEDGRLYVGDIFSPMIMGNLVLASSTVIRRERIELAGRFDEHLVMGEDFEFFLRACRAGPVAFLDVDAIRYRVGNADKLSGLHSPPEMATSYLQVLEATLARDGDRVTLSPAMVSQARRHAHRWVGQIELVAGQRRMARAHFGKVLRLGPWDPATIVLFGLTFLPVPAVQAAIGVRRRTRSWLQRATRLGGSA
jgi:GT2 family glycosyltransferase